MSEETPMDKRIVRRQRNGNQKSSIVDYKEVSKSKPKESANVRPQSNRPSGLDSQRNKCYQKRPQARGNPEVGSVQRPGNKKSGRVPQEDFHRESATGLRRSVSDYGFKLRGQSAAGVEFYNKEQYVHALCQFVVLDLADCKRNLVDPDVPVEWDLVQEVRMLEEQLPACPICLYPPVAGKMTRCGHVFCWPCILHYLALSDKAWRKCPICYDSIYRKQLKSVFVSASWQPHVGDDVNFVLMKRRKGTNLALPVEQWREYEELLGDGDPNSQFSKIVAMKASEIVDRICCREQAELEKELEAQWDQPEKMFIEDALAELKLRSSDLTTLAKNELLKLATPSRPSFSEHPVDDKVSPRAIIPSERSVRYANAFDDVTAEMNCQDLDKVGSVFLFERESLETQSLHEDLLVEALGAPQDTEICSGNKDGSIFGQENKFGTSEFSESKGATARTVQFSEDRDSDDFYYFYQVVDCGLKLMLHPVNMKCLIVEYGGLRQAPLTVKGRLVELERVVMDGNVRRRFRALGHLPVTTELQLAEIRFGRGVISRRTFEQFSDEFQKRRETRQRRNRKDRWQDKRAEFWHQSVMVQQRVDCGYASGLPEQPAGRNRNMNPDIPVITIVKSAQEEIRSGLRSLSLSDSPETPNAEPALFVDLDGPPIGMSEVEWVPTVVAKSGPWGKPLDQFSAMASTAVSNNSVAVPSNNNGENMSFAQKLRTAPKRYGAEWMNKPDPKAAPASPTTTPGGPSSGVGTSATETEESLPAPDFRNAFSDSVAAALDAMNSAKFGEASAEAGTGGKKMKKRTRGIVLFST